VLKFDKIYMTQCAKIIVGLMANFAVFYQTFTNVLFSTFLRFFTFFNCYLSVYYIMSVCMYAV